jgi:spore germination protein KC
MDGSATPELNGTAFFEGDRLAGFLSRQETVWFNFAAGKVKGGLITVSDGSAGPPDSIAFEIISSTTKVTPHLGADGASADVSIKTVCSLCETGAFTKCSGDKEIAAAAVSARKKISSGVALLIKRMQYEGSDIFGFGRDLHAAYPLKQPGGAKNPDDCFRSMRVNVNVAVTVRDTACVNGGIAESRQ